MTALAAAPAVGCAKIPTAAEAGVSYSTAESPWPPEVTCLNDQDVAVAKEVLMGKTRTIVIAGGERPISDEEWQDFRPGPGNTKNSDRHLRFHASCFARSPRAPAECEGDACRSVIEHRGYTWVELSAIEAVDCLPASDACSPDAVEPGSLAFVVTRKCHEMRYAGEQFFLRGPDGEAAILHATPDGTPTADVDLPEGWTLAAEAIDGELVLRPFGGGDECFYNIIRDAKAQAYHQFQYAGERYPTP